MLLAICPHKTAIARQSARSSWLEGHGRYGGLDYAIVNAGDNL